MLHRWLLAGLILLAASQSSAIAANSLVVTPEHRVILQNEVLSFTVTANFSAPESSLSLGELDTDFDVQTIEYNQYSHLINLQQSTSSTWTVTAKPKRKGTLVIPQLSVNQIASAELMIRVLDQRTDMAGNRPDIFIESTLTPNEGFVQQPRLYTVSVFKATDLHNAAVDVTFPDTVVSRALPATRDDNFFKAGRRYQVDTYHYLLLPQIDGDFTLPEPTLTGTIRERNKGSFGKLYTREDTLFVKGVPLNFNVASTPVGFEQGWLPAEDVKLSMAWQSPPDALQLGEPATLELRIDAKGVEGSSLPAPDELWLTTWPDKVRAYPDKPDTTTRIVDGQLVSSKSVIVAVVPDSAGSLTLPALQIPWFNTQTQQPELAGIDEQTLFIDGDSQLMAQNASLQQQNSRSVEQWFWPGTCAILLAYSVMLTLRSRKHSQQPHPDTTITKPITTTPKASYSSLLNDVKHAPFASLFDTLKAYFDAHAGKKQTLHQHVFNLNEPKLQAAVDALYQCHYASIGSPETVREQLVVALNARFEKKTSPSTLQFFQNRHTVKEW